MDQFIPSGTDIHDRSSREWLYYANLSKNELRERWSTPTGRGILQALVVAHRSSEALEQRLGKFNGKFDLHGIPLADRDLAQHDLKDVDFFAANLSRSDLTRLDLSRSYLSESDLRGTKLNWVQLDRTYLDHALFDNDTSFLGVDLNAPNFTLATLLYDLAISQQRIQHLKQHHPIFSFFLRITCDYGRSFSLYTVWVIFFTSSYTFAYWKIPSLLIEQQFQRSFLDCLYFSVVTFAAVGSEGKANLIATHGNRFILHLIFRSLDPTKIDDVSAMHHTIEEAVCTTLDQLIAATMKLYEASYPSNLFKNLTKCREFAEVVQKEQARLKQETKRKRTEKKGS